MTGFTPGREHTRAGERRPSSRALEEWVFRLLSGLGRPGRRCNAGAQAFGLLRKVVGCIPPQVTGVQGGALRYDACNNVAAQDCPERDRICGWLSRRLAHTKA